MVAPPTPPLPDLLPTAPPARKASLLLLITAPLLLEEGTAGVGATVGRTRSHSQVRVSKMNTSPKGLHVSPPSPPPSPSSSSSLLLS